MSNYQQTTKIIQEFNIQQSTTSDITVSSTINIKSTPKQSIKNSNNDLLSEADFQRVVQDITPADRDLFDEFLNGIKQKTDDYLFLSSFDDLPSTTLSQEQDTNSRRHSSLSLPTQTSSIISSDRRRNSILRGSSTIHYSPHSMPISNRHPLPPSSPNVAAQTLKQMAVQHQQRALYNQQQQQQQQVTSYSNYPYNNSTRQYYQQSENDTIIDLVSIQKNFKTKISLLFCYKNTSYYQQPACYPSVQQTSISSYNHHSQQRPTIYGIQNYSYQTSSSFYQQQIPTSSYPINNYSSSNGLPLSTTANTLSSTPFYSQEDNLPILDL